MEFRWSRRTTLKTMMLLSGTISSSNLFSPVVYSDFHLTKEMVMEKPSAQLVGREFVRQYYTLLNQAPDYLHRYVFAQCCLPTLSVPLLVPGLCGPTWPHPPHFPCPSCFQVLREELLLRARRPGWQWEASRGRLWTVGE